MAWHRLPGEGRTCYSMVICQRDKEDRQLDDWGKSQNLSDWMVWPNPQVLNFQKTKRYQSHLWEFHPHQPFQTPRKRGHWLLKVYSVPGGHSLASSFYYINIHTWVWICSFLNIQNWGLSCCMSDIWTYLHANTNRLCSLFHIWQRLSQTLLSTMKVQILLHCFALK